jgi:hypothetical protein
MDERLLSFSHFKMEISNLMHCVQERRHQPIVELMQIIERDIDLVPCLIERHRVLV